MHPCQGIWVAFGREVVYFTQADHEFSAGIKCRHCTYITGKNKVMLKDVYEVLSQY